MKFHVRRQTTEADLMAAWANAGGWDRWIRAWVEARRGIRSVGVFTGLYIDLLPDLFPNLGKHVFSFENAAE
jgi:hypothetical protein